MPGLFEKFSSPTGTVWQVPKWFRVIKWSGPHVKTYRVIEVKYKSIIIVVIIVVIIIIIVIPSDSVWYKQ